LVSEGYDQSVILLSGNPCVARISLEWFDQMREVTWDEVGREERRAPVVDDQKWMVWSLVPPPVARRLVCQGHHAIA
jgi:hypothetical protein